MTRPQRNPRRSYGTGSLFTARGKWYGQWRVGGKQVKRAIGPKRQSGSREGLTRKQAEAELRRLMQEVRSAPPGEHLTLEEAGERLLGHLEALGRKPSTLATYRSLLATHLEPLLGEVPLDQVEPEQIEQLIAAMRRDGKSAKLTHNALTLLHQIFEFGQRKGWCRGNPSKAVNRPKVEQSSEVRFLEMEEVEALLQAVPQGDPLGPTDRTL